ncbi:MAG: heparinase II/III domain-containing protein, partial [Rhodoferax sp.]
YRPDGVYPEGPSYWNYGTTYEVLLISSLQNALNTDWGLMDAPGLKRSALFYAHSAGPSGKSFNFSDGGEGQELSAAIFYFAQVLQQPALVTSKLEMIRRKQGLSERFAPLIALWWPAAGGSEAALHFSGQGPQPVAIWRSSWTDPNALYFAIKGGGAAHNHAHMDAGSFVLDQDGVRWAKDLGMQDYNSLESQGIDLWNMRQDSPRWKVFRLGSDAHNTLTIDDQPHSATGMATLAVQGEQDGVIDMSAVFQAGQLTRALRSVRVEPQTVTLSDRVTGLRPGRSVRWAMATEAAISLQGQQVALTFAGKHLQLRFSGTPVTLEVRDISRPANPLDSANPNTRQLLAHAPVAADGSWDLTVHFSRD